MGQSLVWTLCCTISSILPCFALHPSPSVQRRKLGFFSNHRFIPRLLILLRQVLPSSVQGTFVSLLGRPGVGLRGSQKIHQTALSFMLAAGISSGATFAVHLQKSFCTLLHFCRLGEVCELLSGVGHGSRGWLLDITAALSGSYKVGVPQEDRVFHEVHSSAQGCCTGYPLHELVR